MKKSSCAATMTRLNTSRPSWSVPNQCRTDGGFSAASVLLASGSYGTREGPSRAASTISTNIPKATPVTGFSEMT
jgi:hypothetical protein